MYSRLLPTTLAATAALLAVLVMPGPTQAASAANSAASRPSRSSIRATALLEQVQRDAWAIRNQADELQMLTGEATHPSEEVRYTSQAEVLAHIRGRANAMDQAMRRLRTHVAQLQPWQLQAVHQLTPGVVELTDNTPLALNALNMDRGA